MNKTYEKKELEQVIDKVEDLLIQLKDVYQTYIE